MTPKHIRTAIVLMKRAPCKGDEARNIADAIDAFEAMFTALTTPPIEEENGDDA